jgi:hypothetical protein
VIQALTMLPSLRLCCHSASSNHRIFLVEEVQRLRRPKETEERTCGDLKLYCIRLREEKMIHLYA